MDSTRGLRTGHASSRAHGSELILTGRRARAAESAQALRRSLHDEGACCEAVLTEFWQKGILRCGWQPREMWAT